MAEASPGTRSFGTGKEVRALDWRDSGVLQDRVGIDTDTEFGLYAYT